MTWGESGLFCLQFQITVIIQEVKGETQAGWEGEGRNWQELTQHREKGAVCRFSLPVLLSLLFYIIQDPLPRVNTVHSELAPPSSIFAQICPQLDLRRHFLNCDVSSKMTAACVK